MDSQLNIFKEIEFLLNSHKPAEGFYKLLELIRQYATIQQKQLVRLLLNEAELHQNNNCIQYEIDGKIINAYKTMTGNYIFEHESQLYKTLEEISHIK